MTTTVLVFHPDISTSRVNAALAKAAEATTGVEVRDLYKLYPDFTIDIGTEQKTLEAADRIVFQFPMYWYSTPPLLKKWQDDVLTYGWAYGSTGKALNGKELGIAVSPGSPGEKYQRDGSYHYTVTELLRPLQAVSNLIGTRYVTPFITAGSMSLGTDDLTAQAAAYQTWLTSELGTVGELE
ncbi:hypothetical protein HMPREF1531_01624 [Propionibacterium sp. oral taxon 192 str. F0372]|uniref:NAD(P)H-dependent oxidoreductase n=1 Tax=Propionibacterium sp. oral taxon 192 TaxID=671222 RepID=UPI0003540CF7|nr:NAD(P)H-dependent oxidoreductase [Propionibacterium sp. oral taxon 192]EPH02318.1 hypothetical protein HMPREF1531_01624 [Propionibacterium sp. oral taxon 192 str. F0372]